MSASLVGSEMCIRDRLGLGSSLAPGRRRSALWHFGLPPLPGHTGPCGWGRGCAFRPAAGAGRPS
eukprot:13208685-Alexandrium_andersonii.AAC.1